MPKKVLKKKPLLRNLILGKHEEKVMVVKRADLFADGIWNGLKNENLQKYINLISKKHKFLPRSQVEQDPNWQQIIPYLVFENSGKIFLMRRRADHSDLRLANNYSIGIGGHINIKDIKVTKGTKGTEGTRGNGIMAWARREFEEEICYEGNYKTNFLGLLNDDSNDVGLVHLGLVIQITGDSDQISIRDEHKLGKLVGVGEAGKYYKQMETWSQIVYDYLVSGRNRPYSSSGAKRNREVSSKNIMNFKVSSRPFDKLRARTVTMSDNIVGILPDWMIEEFIEKGVIKISPLEKNWRTQIDQVSMDFHLGGNIKLFRGGTYRFIDTRRGLPEDAMEEVNLKDGDPFILEPGAFAIATTKEVLKLPQDILGRLEGKSSLARLGILVHSTAARFDPGWNGAPVLELGNLGPKPAILYCGMPICAFTFEAIAASVKMPYEGSRSDRYSGAKVPVASRIHRANRKLGKPRKKK